MRKALAGLGEEGDSEKAEEQAPLLKETECPVCLQVGSRLAVLLRAGGAGDVGCSEDAEQCANCAGVGRWALEKGKIMKAFQSCVSCPELH